MASITKTPPMSNKRISFFSKTAIVPNAAPMAREPVSPMKIFAGLALNHKKPIDAPTKERQKINNSPVPGRYMIFR